MEPPGDPQFLQNKKVDLAKDWEGLKSKVQRKSGDYKDLEFK